MSTFPPSLPALKVDLQIDDAADNEALQACLDAAVAFVVRRLGAKFNVLGNPLSLLPAPPADVVLGTVRLAGRWYTRRRSPDGLVASAEFGTSRIPTFDADIERLLRIGRYAGPVIG